MPLFMYLTDDRTKTLHELIYPQQPELFKKVTGLTHKDFEYLVDLGLFNGALMNHAIYNFRKYEEPSRSYTGKIMDMISMHKEGYSLGLEIACDGVATSIVNTEYKRL